MRFPWCLLWLAILVAVVLTIPLINRPGDMPRNSHTNQESPLLPMSSAPDQVRP